MWTLESIPLPHHSHYSGILAALLLQNVVASVQSLVIPAELARVCMKARENTDEVKTCLPWIWCAMATPSIRTTHDIAVVMARIRPSPVVASCLMLYRFSIESDRKSVV